MRRASRIPFATFAMVFATSACVVSSSSSQPTPPTNEGRPVSTTESSSEGKPIASGETTPPAEPRDPEALRRDRLQRALAELEAEYKKEAERWTPELGQKVAKLSATKWRSTPAALEAILASDHRSPEDKARDAHRHPKETLAAFGIKPTMTVFEVGPGKGWWTEILAPLLATSGKLKIASYDTKSKDPMTVLAGRGTELLLASSPALYGKVETVPNVLNSFEFGEPNSLDAIMVMRMMHNLVRNDRLDAFLTEAHDTLKKGGILAIEQHRAAPGADPRKSAEQGYLPEAWLIEQVEAAGFELDEKSEVNANPKDTKDHPEGVWSLPPTFAEGDKNKAKYAAIGESDRSTLKFVKVKAKKAVKDAGVKSITAGTRPTHGTGTDAGPATRAKDAGPAPGANGGPAGRSPNPAKHTGPAKDAAGSKSVTDGKS